MRACFQLQFLCINEVAGYMDRGKIHSSQLAQICIVAGELEKLMLCAFALESKELYAAMQWTDLSVGNEDTQMQLQDAHGSISAPTA